MNKYKRPFFVPQTPGRLVDLKKFQHENLEGGDSPEGCARDIVGHIEQGKLKPEVAETFAKYYISVSAKIYAGKVELGELDSPAFTETQFEDRVRAEMERLE